MDNNQILEIIKVSHEIMRLIDEQTPAIHSISKSSKVYFDMAYEEIGVAIAHIESKYNIGYDDWGNPFIK